MSYKDYVTISQLYSEKMQKGAPGRTSRRKQEAPVSRSVGAIIVSTYNILSAELMTHIKGAGYI